VLRSPLTKPDATELALRALAWTVSDGDRAGRLLGLTGLTPDDLRARAGTRPVLGAVLGFLEAHQPDLLACAEDLDVPPEALAAARQELDR
jgi:hypothetical protein